MAETKVAISVEANVGSLRSQIKQATQEVIALSSKFGELSPEAVQAAKRVAQLKDQLQDARELVDALDPGKKFAAVSSAIRTVTGSFAALQGGLALFGVESAEVEKQLLKVQAALALSEGVSTILDASRSFKVLGAIIKTQVVTALTTLRGALIATGIGAAAVAVGLLVANFEKVKEAAFNLIPGLQRVADFVGRLVNKVKEFTGIAASERAKAEIDARDALAQREDDAQKAAAEAEKNRQQEAQQAAAQRARERAQERERIRREQEQQAEEERKRREERNDEAYFDARQVGNQVAEDEKQRIADSNVFIAGALSERLVLLSQQAQAEKAINEQRARDKEAADFIEIQSERNKQAVIGETSALIGGLADLAGRQTAAGKALAIAQATIDTYAAVSSVFFQAAKNPVTIAFPAYPYIQAAGALVAGIGRIKAITAVKVPGGGGGGGAIPANANAPLTPTAPVPQVGVTRLDAQTVNNLGNKAVRAYVLETDITDQQTRQRRIERAAVLGG
jgi:hypothetical protein